MHCRQFAVCRDQWQWPWQGRGRDIQPGTRKQRGAAWRPTATSPPTRFICVWYWQIYLLISPSIQGDFGGRMSKSSSYKQGPSLVARQSKGYSGDRSHTASGYPLVTSASKRSIQMFVITEKAPTRAFSLLKVDVKLGPRHNYHEGRATIRHYAHQPALPI